MNHIVYARAYINPIVTTTRKGPSIYIAEDVIKRNISGADMNLGICMEKLGNIRDKIGT
jgi:hypothetical protein